MIMKRKAAAQPPMSAISAVAARRNKQKLADDTQSATAAASSPIEAEPPSKRPKSSAAQTRSKDVTVKETTVLEPKDTSDSKSTKPGREIEDPTLSHSQEEVAEEGTDYIPLYDAASQSTEESSDTDNSSESQTAASQKWEDFLLSKSRLGKQDIVYDTHEGVCLRLKLKSLEQYAKQVQTLVLVGQYDLWVKAGVVSILGAKLHATATFHRVYSPSTHSLPVIKCVSGGVSGYAEIELRSCHSGLAHLEKISNLYHRIWNCEHTIPRKRLECDERSSFSALHSASDDQFRRIIRPLHLEKKWSVAIKILSQRGSGLRVLTFGPKASGKSTFNKYLLNHLLSIPPSQDVAHAGKDGVAFLDLDPGQPEFSTAGHIYLAHMRSPVLGPPFSHPTIDGQDGDTTIRTHYIGATSPKDDSEHYVMAITDLMDRFHQLRHQYPQCCLIINYPGWIFGQGLEIATWLVNSIGLSDVVYMSEKGPEEVVEPLGAAASQSGVPMTILPSQPTEYASRSSLQLRSMQMLSYFHSFYDSRSAGLVWNDTPLVRSRPLTVNYSGDKQGLLGIMTPGLHYEPDILHDLLDGAVVGVVALESLNAVAERKTARDDIYEQAAGRDVSGVDNDAPMDESDGTPTLPSLNIVRTRDQLPYLFIGSGTCAPPDPRQSHSLGQAIVRSINTSPQTLDLLTPIPAAVIRSALDHDYRIVLVRGQLDHPNWAISEEYFAARDAWDRHRKLVAQQQQISRPQKGKSATASAATDGSTRAPREDDDDTADKKRERVRRAASVPWMHVSSWDDGGTGTGKTQRRRDKRIWKLGKNNTDPGVESV